MIAVFFIITTSVVLVGWAMFAIISPPLCSIKLSKDCADTPQIERINIIDNIIFFIIPDFFDIDFQLP
ncbi:hypothetical protein HR10_09990 [Porphyromonas gulae]|uniref:Uncharacterized protein n=1 Tax=Porphyromonas gulae TaxID=111105 RepID=A0A0A2FJE4_9PORP|nr:hypothetical protein HR15_03145 [Porphyromonas gulae]KKC50425.1 hypothetical protein HR10_09990 [Porphyromonas gulae]